MEFSYILDKKDAFARLMKENRPLPDAAFICRVQSTLGNLPKKNWTESACSAAADHLPLRLLLLLLFCCAPAPHMRRYHYTKMCLAKQGSR